MNTEQRSSRTGAQSIFTNGDMERALNEGRRLRAEAMRSAFSRLRPSLGLNG